MRAGYLTIFALLFCQTLPGQSVTSISPASAKPTDTVTVAGTNLAGITGVILKAGAV